MQGYWPIADQLKTNVGGQQMPQEIPPLFLEINHKSCPDVAGLIFVKMVKRRVILAPRFPWGISATDPAYSTRSFNRMGQSSLQFKPLFGNAITYFSEILFYIS